VVLAIEALPWNDHDRQAGIEASNALDEDEGKMKITSIGQDVDPEWSFWLNPWHPTLDETIVFRRTIKVISDRARSKAVK
jgi:hypothetical protein